MSRSSAAATPACRRRCTSPRPASTSRSSKRKRVGWGASGRNGGQLHSGQRRDQDWLEEQLGRDDAHHLWQPRRGGQGAGQGPDRPARDRLRLARRPDRDRRTSGASSRHEIAYVEKLKRDYGYAAVEWLDRDALAAAIGTDVYFGGRRDTGRRPSRSAEIRARAGARRREGRGAHLRGDAGRPSVTGSAATRIRRSPARTGGELAADIVVLAGDGYLDGIDAEIEARVMPIDNYILATAPIGAGRPGGIIPGGEAVSDTRFVVYYFRPTADGRLVFGGGETYSRRAAARHRRLRAPPSRSSIYPQLADTRIDYAWGGTLAITLHRLPFIRRVRPGVYAASGYSGQGVALAPFAGKVIADAIVGDPARLDRFAALPCPRFPGGKLLRHPALVAGMLWYALRDRL